MINSNQHLFQNTEIDGRTPLMKACKNGNLLIVQYLIGHGVDVNSLSSHQDATALLLACASGHKDIVKLLLHSGADPNVELKDGINCILEAARNGYKEIVELMLDHSGVPNSSAPAYLPNAKKFSGQQGPHGTNLLKVFRIRIFTKQQIYSGGCNETEESVSAKGARLRPSRSICQRSPNLHTSLPKYPT